MSQADSIPRATARLQLHRDFTLDQAAALVDYYAALGVSHLYLSPIFCAQPGSSHGYDVIDPTRVNPELGGEDGLRRLVRRLRAKDMGLILDIVPNHMGVGAANGWWQDMLAWGQSSRYACWFDVDWRAADPVLKDKILLPFLAQTPAPLMLLPLEDILGLPDAPNLPGTIETHPNWRRRMPRPVAHLLDDPMCARRLALLGHLRS